MSGFRHRRRHTRQRRARQQTRTRAEPVKKKETLDGKAWQTCYVVATGPSLTAAQAERCRFSKTLVVNDAWRLIPTADVLYAADAAWWDISAPSAAQFAGERWSSTSRKRKDNNNKEAAAARHGLKLIDGADGHGFCLEPGRIHYGNNSGFQGINLAIQFGARKIVLLGFDMQPDGNRRHFFGDHPKELNNAPNYAHFIGAFNTAARMLPSEIEIINATPGSALTCFRSEVP